MNKYNKKLWDSEVRVTHGIVLIIFLIVSLIGIITNAPSTYWISICGLCYIGYNLEPAQKSEEMEK